MLLSFFRINDPYRLPGVLVMMIIMSLPFMIGIDQLTLQELKGMVVGEAVAGGKLMYTEVFDATPPLAALAYGFLDLLFGRSLLSRHIAALLILFFQASFFAILVINAKAYLENTYLPALIFAILAFFSFDVLTISGPLLASTVLLFALNNLFREIEFKMQRDETVLNLGFYLGLTTLIVFTYWVFLPTVILLLSVYARITIRKIGLLLFGFFLPHLLLFCVYYFPGELTWLYSNFYGPHLSFTFGSSKLPFTALLILGAVPVAYLLFSFVMLTRQARLTNYQSQLLQGMFLWMMAGVLVILITPAVTPASLVIFFPPVVYFISYYLMLIRRRWRAEIMLWIFLISVMGVSLLAVHGRLQFVNYSPLYAKSNPHPIKGKAVMVLGDDWGWYVQNSLGGFFLDWRLSMPVLQNPDLYHNTEKIAQCFEEAPPEIIIDRESIMPALISRIPSLREKYRKQGDQYVLVTR